MMVHKGHHVFSSAHISVFSYVCPNLSHFVPTYINLDLVNSFIIETTNLHGLQIQSGYFDLLCTGFGQFNSLSWGRCHSNFTGVTFKLIWWIDILGLSFKLVVKWMLNRSIGDKLTIDSGNSLVPSGNQPLPEHQTIPWANVGPDLCCHMVFSGHNEPSP